MNVKPDYPKYIFLCAAGFSASLVILILGFILMTAVPVLMKEGFHFITGSTWNYETHEYGIWIFLTGTIILSMVTIIMAFPLGLGTAIFLSEWAPTWTDRILSSFIELLVGIPSVVYGIFGYFVLKNVFRDQINPTIDHVLGFIPIFRNNSINSGEGILLTATVLAIMILPTIMALSRDAMRDVSKDLREASLSLGTTKWETIQHVVLPTASPGIMTGLILGIMRAMGETMAVVMILGNTMQVPGSVLDQGYAMTSKILGDIGFYVMVPEGKSALFAIAAVLFVIEILFVAGIRFTSNYWRRSRGIIE